MSKSVQINSNIQITYSGRVTVANITDDRGNLFTGVAKCNPIDKYSRDIGQSIATARAVKKMANHIEKEWIARASTKVDWATRHPNKAKA